MTRGAAAFKDCIANLSFYFASDLLNSETQDH